MMISDNRWELDTLLDGMSDWMKEEDYGRFLMKEAARELAGVNPDLSVKMYEFLTKEF
jgi:hypothetical protein